MVHRRCVDRPDRPRGAALPAQYRVSSFQPWSTTAWHSHEGGQTLYVSEGRGLVQTRDGNTIDIRSGDVVYTPDGEEHWHGATPDRFLTHLSITEGPPHWGDHVTDAEYQASRPL